jgi:hypothetical protein
MAKFYGNVGYIETVEIEPGLWEEQIKERPYFGDVTRNTSRFQSSGDINDDININNSISILADPYANENFQYMKYVEFMGTKWKITNAEIQYPRILLTIGGVYNGK